MEVRLELSAHFSSSSRAMFNVLKATLEYPASTQVKARKLADDIMFLCKSDQDPSPPFWEIWPVFLALVSNVPSDHEWQNSLILSLTLLRQQDGSASEHNQLLLWKDLPGLSMAVAEHWNAVDNPSNLGEFDQGIFFRWENLNTFLARASTAEFAPWLNLSIWQLQEALEERVEVGFLTDSKIWVASEWIIHCSDLLSKAMNEEGSPKDGYVINGKPGELCRDLPARSMERWEFWKKRISEMAADPTNLKLESDTVKKLSKAMEVLTNPGK